MTYIDPEQKKLRYEGYKSNYLNWDLTRRELIEGLQRCGMTELEAVAEADHLRTMRQPQCPSCGS